MDAILPTSRAGAVAAALVVWLAAFAIARRPACADGPQPVAQSLPSGGVRPYLEWQLQQVERELAGLNRRIEKALLELEIAYQRHRLDELREDLRTHPNDHIRCLRR